MGKSRQVTLNPTQTRPLAGASFFFVCAGFGLLSALFSCNAADRQQSAPQSPPPLAASAFPTPPVAAPSAPQPLLLDTAAAVVPLPSSPSPSDAGAPHHYVI